MGFDQTLDDGKAEPGALVGNRDVMLALAEAFKHQRLIGRRDADTGVRDPEQTAPRFPPGWRRR